MVREMTTVGTGNSASKAAQRKRRKALRLFGYASPLVLAAVLIVAPSASAATYTYANAASTSENAYHYSGTRATITGGQAQTEPFSAEGALPEAFIETYRPAPGYQTIGFSSGGTTANLSHAAATNVQSKCHWDWPWAGGNVGKLKITCKAYS